MERSLYPSQIRKIRKNSKKNKVESVTVESAKYINDFSIAISFSSGFIKIVNFFPLFEMYAKGINLKYFALEKFKKFIVKNGNIYWGRNEDLIFPISSLLKFNELQHLHSEEILYII